MAFKVKHQVFHNNEWHTITPLVIKPVQVSDQVQPVDNRIYFWVDQIDRRPAPVAPAPFNSDEPQPVYGLTRIDRNSKHFRIVSTTKAIVSKATGKVSELIDDDQPIPASDILADQGLVLVEMRIL